jgi:putative nucleotidyltransferase with HDIG domain
VRTPLDLTAVPPLVGTLIAEGQRAEAAGQRELARRRYESALYLLRGDMPSTPSLASSLLRWIGRTHFEESSFDVGEDCLDAALAVAEAGGNDGDIAHALNQIAAGSHLRGDIDAADEQYRLAATFADRSADTRLQAMVAQNRGIIASMRGDWTSALDHYGASLHAYGALGLDELRGVLLSNRALTFLRLNRLDDAEVTLHEALAICDAAGNPYARLMVRVNLIEVWIAKGALDRAAEMCEEVLREGARLDQPTPVAEAHKMRGVIRRMRGDLQAAEEDLAHAYELATLREEVLLAAETAREQAELFELMGRDREVLQTLSLSHKLFEKLRARRDLADLDRRVERLEERFADVVGRWAQEIESKDVYTLGHCERVAQYACNLARATGFDSITMFWFRIGALLHDVGKIAVPSEILNKAGPLTADERRVMEKHPVAGVELLQDIHFPWDVLPMIRGHHERWDGTGYPDRLAGGEIPLAARIICVADVYDALTTTRSYRPAFSRSEALAMMAADAGRMFDPALFSEFARLMTTSDATLSWVHGTAPAMAR